MITATRDLPTERFKSADDFATAHHRQLGHSNGHFHLLRLDRERKTTLGADFET
jgi:hypothetical protein